MRLKSSACNVLYSLRWWHVFKSEYVLSSQQVQCKWTLKLNLTLNLYIYTAVLVKIYLKFKFADECFDLSTIGILPFFIELSPFSINFSLFVPNSYNSVYKICVPFTFRKLVFLLFLFFFIIRRYRVCQKETSNMLTAEPLFCLKHSVKY